MLSNITRALCLAAAFGLTAGAVAAQEPVKIGLILPMTGPFTSTGKQITAAVNLYMQQHGDTVAGRKVEVILRDDAGNPESTKRLAQDLIVNSQASLLAGFGLTPLALVAAPLATQAKVPEIIMAAGTSIITERSPFIVRTSFTVPQSAKVMAEWAAQNNIKTAVTMVTDYAPGHDAESSFTGPYKAAGGQVLAALRVPLQNPDFAPFLQRAADAKPDALFVFVPSGPGAIVMKQYVERGMDKAGIKMIGTGDLTDDDILPGYGDVAIGIITAHFYATAHTSAANQAYVEAFKKGNPGMRPNFMSVGGYDGMHLIYEALKKTGGKTDGTALVEAMKGMRWESPRGPIQIDPETRDIIQNIYIRKVERVNGELQNVEFATFEAVKDPVKAAEKK
jgi:branched-chain amino acid transport system substrate-binding protein